MNDYIKVRIPRMFHIAFPLGVYAMVKYTRESIFSKR
jgi:hypothetical protein